MLIDDQTFQLLNKTIKRDGWLDLPAFGNSMYPFIKQGNLCRFISCDSSIIKKGDIILFYSPSGYIVAHRLISIKKIQSKLLFQLKGDTNLGCDPLIEEEQIIGKLVHVQKQNIQLNSDYFISRLWGGIILSYPALSGILRKYLNRKLQL
jgi:signal peptidase I